MTRGNRLLMLILSLVLPLVTGCHQPASKQPERDVQEEFQRKLECKRLEKDIRQGEDQDQTAITTLYVFYSSKMNSCLVAKRSLFMPAARKVSGVAELIEIDDVLENQTLWSRSFAVAQQAQVSNELMQAQMGGIK